MLGAGEDGEDKCAKNVIISLIMHALKFTELKTSTQYVGLANFSGQ